MGDISSIGKIVMFAGLIVVFVGGALWLVGKTGLPLGRLPGDFRFERGGFSCFVPLATSILLSLLLTLALNVILRLLNR